MSAVSVPVGLRASLAVAEEPWVALIRHSDRYSFRPDECGNETTLTKIGEQRARALGQWLGEPPAWALSSPLVRCVRTAELIGVTPQPSTLLGDPGPFVVDPEASMRVFVEHGTEAVVRAHIAGNTWDCMRAVAAGASLVWRELQLQLSERCGYGVAVSHDAVVMPVIAWLTGYDFGDEWLAPLDGVVIGRDTVIWQGQRFQVSR